MELTQAQKTTLKANLQANNATIVNAANGQAIAIKLVIPNTATDFGDNMQRVADWYNLTASPAYWAWRSSVSRSDVYTTIDDASNSWSWSTYKAQAAVEQNAWVQMFMGDQMNMGQLNNRQGIQAIFGGAAPGNAQRDHCFAVGRRGATNLEKVFVTAVASPPANTGNDGIAGNRGKTTNPDVLGFEGTINGNDVFDALLNG